MVFSITYVIICLHFFSICVIITVLSDKDSDGAMRLWRKYARCRHFIAYSFMLAHCHHCFAGIQRRCDSGFFRRKVRSVRKQEGKRNRSLDQLHHGRIVSCIHHSFHLISILCTKILRKAGLADRPFLLDNYHVFTKTIKDGYERKIIGNILRARLSAEKL